MSRISTVNIIATAVLWLPYSAQRKANHQIREIREDRCFQALSHNFSAVYRMKCRVKQHSHPVGFSQIRKIGYLYATTIPSRFFGKMVTTYCCLAYFRQL